MLIVFISIAFLPSGIFGFGKMVTVGGLFEDDDLTANAFRLSADVLNNERHGNPRLPKQFIVAQIITVNNDTYDVSQAVCNIANNGVAAIFGPRDKIAARQVRSMCDTMEIPHIIARWDPRQTRGNGLLNMYPYSQTLSRIYLQLAKDLNWQSFTILYESIENLIRMHELLKRWDRQGYAVTVRQLPEGPNYRKVLQQIEKSGDVNIVVDCSIDVLPDVLKQAQQVGLMSGTQSFIIAPLDLSTLDLEPYQYSGTKIVGLRLIDPEDPVVIDIFEKNALRWGVESPSQITAEAALIYDGVQMFGRVLRQLDDIIVADTKTSLCENIDSWEHGSSLMNIMRSIEFTGMTGLIKFDSYGYRSDFKLDLMNLNWNGLEKIGTWNTTHGIQYSPIPSLNDRTVETPPYGMLKESAERVTGNNRYEGFGIDIIQELSKILGFKYIFEVQTDNVYGSKDRITGEWNGMIKKIMDDRADLAITDFTITAERQEAVDFTAPFMNLGISVLFTKPKAQGSSLFAFLMPFSNEVWKYLMGTYLVVTLFFFMAARLCPTEWDNPYPCIDEPEELENQFTFKNAFWFTIGSIMQQGSEIMPIGFATRMMAGFWGIFIMVMVSSYIANLAVFLVIESKPPLIKRAEDLLNNPHGIKYGAKRSGSTIEFFKASEDPVYKEMREYMMKNEEELLPTSNDIGVRKVMVDNYAFFMESSTINYETERKCNITQVGSLLDAKSYGIAMKKNSPYRNALSTSILKLQEMGILKELENKWWKQKRGGGACEEKKGTSASKPLGVDNVGGVFVVLMTGVALAGVWTVCELLWAAGCTSKRDNVPFLAEVKEELKFAVKFGTSSKPVRRRKTISSSNQSNEGDSNGVSTPPCGLVPNGVKVAPEDDRLHV